MPAINTITIIGFKQSCQVSGLAVLTFKLQSTASNINQPLKLSWNLYDKNLDDIIKSGSKSGYQSDSFSCYDVPNGDYTLNGEDQQGNTDSVDFTVSCSPTCTITQLDTTYINPATGPTNADGQVTFNKPSTNPLQYQLEPYSQGSWQGNEVFSGLLPGNYVGKTREINNTACLSTKNVIIPYNYVASGFVADVEDIIAVTNNALNNGGATLNMSNLLNDRTYDVSVKRADTGVSVFTEQVVNLTSRTINFTNLTNVVYIVSVVETDGGGTTKTITQNFTIPKEVYGCTNVNATNFNQSANLDDGSCIVPTGNTGRLGYRLLEEYFLDDSSATGRRKRNVSNDPDYIPPIVDTNSCPI